MKFHIKIFLGTLGLILLMCQTTEAQTNWEPLESYQDSLTFDGQEFIKDVTLIITKESSYFRLNIDGKIKDGQVSAALYTKIGRRICNLKLKAKIGGQAKGNIGEVLNVREGIYTLKIRSDGGHGFLNVDFSQH